MNKKLHSRIMACLLAICMLIGLMPMSTFAITTAQGGQIIVADNANSNKADDNVTATTDDDAPTQVSAPDKELDKSPLGTNVDNNSGTLNAR